MHVSHAVAVAAAVAVAVAVADIIYNLFVLFANYS